MINYDELDVEYGDVKNFWKKNEMERYKYFRNCCFHYFGLVEVLREEYKAPEEFVDRLKSIFMNISFFLVYIMTTEKEQEKEIEIVWINRFKKEVSKNKDEDPFFVDFENTGTA